MRTLVEQRVLEVLDEMAADSMEIVEATLDMDMGYWNADDGPAMTKEVYTQIVKDCDNEELLELYDFLFSFGG